jgi:hypothetical protein
METLCGFADVVPKSITAIVATDNSLAMGYVLSITRLHSNIL